MPILHLAQLLGAADAIREDQLKFQRHVVRIGTKARRTLLGRPEPSTNGDAAPPAAVPSSGH